MKLVLLGGGGAEGICGVGSGGVQAAGIGEAFWLESEGASERGGLEILLMAGLGEQVLRWLRWAVGGWAGEVCCYHLGWASYALGAKLWCWKR